MRYQRSLKDSHVSVVWYEIDMMHFACDSLRDNGEAASLAEKNLLIEGALLHYRNLLRFFSGNNHRKGDLSTARPAAWSCGKMTSQQLAQSSALGKKLERAHWSDISRYLQHITEVRATEFMDWGIDEMRVKLEPALSTFAECFPRGPSTNDQINGHLA